MQWDIIQTLIQWNIMEKAIQWKITQTIQDFPFYNISPDINFKIALFVNIFDIMITYH